MSHLPKDVRNEDRALEEGKINSPVPLFDETSTTSWPAVEVFIDTDESQNGEKSADNEQSSDIWSVFTRIDDALAKCNLCQIELSCKDSIADLTAHREVEHLGVLLQCDSSEDDAEKCEDEDSASQPQDQSTLSVVEEGSEGENFEKVNKSRKNTFDAQDSDESPDLRPSKRKKRENPLVEIELEEVPIDESLQSSQNQNSVLENNAATGVDKRRGPRSFIWKMYTKLKNGCPECKICGAILSEKSDVSNLRRHIKRVHPSCKSAMQYVDSSSYAWKMFSKLKNGCSECKVCGAILSEKASLGSLMRHTRAHPSCKNAIQKRNAASEVETGKRKRSGPIIHTLETAARSDGESARPRTAGGASGGERPPDPPEEREGTFRNVRRGCLFSERSVLAVEERNRLIRDLQDAMERQGQVLDRIVACLEGMSRLQKNGT